MAMQFCFKCKNTGIILEKRPSEYPGSYDYYPVPCPYCERGKIIAREREKKGKNDNNNPLISPTDSQLSSHLLRYLK